MIAGAATDLGRFLLKERDDRVVGESLALDTEIVDVIAKSSHRKKPHARTFASISRSAVQVHDVSEWQFVRRFCSRAQPQSRCVRGEEEANMSRVGLELHGGKNRKRRLRGSWITFPEKICTV